MILLHESPVRDTSVKLVVVSEESIESDMSALKAILFLPIIGNDLNIMT